MTEGRQAGDIRSTVVADVMADPTTTRWTAVDLASATLEVPDDVDLDQIGGCSERIWTTFANPRGPRMARFLGID
jgi:hypothetical protein